MSSPSRPPAAHVLALIGAWVVCGMLLVTLLFLMMALGLIALWYTQTFVHWRSAACAGVAGAAMWAWFGWGLICVIRYARGHGLTGVPWPTSRLHSWLVRRIVSGG
jgi:hypothetical protein